MPEIKVQINAEGNAAQVATTAKEAIKGVTDESARYQQVLERMAGRDSDAAQDQRLAAITEKAHAHTAALQAQAEATAAYFGAGQQAIEVTEQQTRQLQDLTPEEKKAAEGMRLFHGEGSEARRIITELNRITPELGEAFRLLRSPIGGAVAAAIGVFVELKAHINEVNQALDEMAAHNAEANFLPNIEDRLSVFADAAGAAQAYADKLNQIATGTQSVNDKLRDQLGLDKAIEQANATLVSAQKGLAIAQVQRDEAEHKITPEQAAEKRAQIEKDFIAQQQQAHEDAQATQLADQKKQLAEDLANADELARKQQETADAVTQDEAHRASVKASLPDLNKQLADTRGEMEAKEKEFKSRFSPAVFALPEDQLSNVQLQARKDVESWLQPYVDKIARIQSEIKQFNATQTPEAAAGLAHEKFSAKQAELENTENIQQIRELNDSIKQLIRVIGQTRPKEREAADTKQSTVGAQEDARIAAQFERDAKTLNSFARAHNPSTEMYDKMKAAMDDIMGILRTHTELVKALPDYADAIKDLKRDAEAASARQDNSRNFGVSG